MILACCNLIKVKVLRVLIKANFKNIFWLFLVIFLIFLFFSYLFIRLNFFIQIFSPIHHQSFRIYYNYIFVAANHIFYCEVFKLLNDCWLFDILEIRGIAKIFEITPEIKFIRNR